ncbi:MAG: hypothetical protein MUQ56_06710, partial [Thermoleophilia bacterium]|nr:hypothetical protein [Thermoleophilia bacterium]
MGEMIFSSTTETPDQMRQDLGLPPVAPTVPAEETQVNATSIVDAVPRVDAAPAPDSGSPEEPPAEDTPLTEAEKPSAPRHASAQKRIDELTRQYREEQRRADRLEGEMQAIRRQLDGSPSPTPGSP